MSSFSSSQETTFPQSSSSSFSHATTFLHGQILTRAIETFLLFFLPLASSFPALPIPSPSIISQLQALACHQSKILFTVVALWYPPESSSLSCHTALSGSSCTYICSLLFSPHPFSLIFPSLSPTSFFKKNLNHFGSLTLSVQASSVLSFQLWPLHELQNSPCHLFPRFKTTTQLIYVMYGVSSLLVVSSPET